MAVDPWTLFGIGGTPSFFDSGGDISNLLSNLNVGAASQINLQPQGAGVTNVWDAIANVGSAVASSLLSPATQPQITIPGVPVGQMGCDLSSIQGILNCLTPFQQATVPQLNTKALTANCATTAGMSGLPCVVHQSGPYKGKLVQHSRRRRIKLVPDGQGSLTPVICCTKPRMNPLNPRALSRAARRLASFQHIARGIDAMITRQICSRRSSGRGRGRRSFGGYRGRSCKTRC